MNNDALLGVLTASVLVIAIVQVAMFVWATRVAKRVSDSVQRLEQDVQPILAGLRTVAAEGARAATLAATQVERIDQVLGLLRAQIDRTVRAVQDTVFAPARDAAALVQAIREVFFGAGARSAGGDRRRRQPAEDDDALFIG